jgi:hypothetical protein
LQAVKLRCKELQIVPKGIFEENKEIREQRKVIHKNVLFGHVLGQTLLFLPKNAKKEAALQLLPW